MVNQTEIPTIRSGNQMVAFMGQQDVGRYFQGYMDNASLEQWYEEDPLESHLGLMSFWNQQKRSKPVSLFDELITNKSVIETNGWEGKFTYELPIEETKGCYTEDDLSHQSYAGIDGNIFYISLNREFAPGTVMTYDDFDGEQIIVSEEEPVRMTGSGYKHPVKVVSLNKRRAFPASKLGKGIEYFVVSHGTSEYGTQFARYQMPDKVGSQVFEFRLGSIQGVESYITGKADSKSAAGWATASTKEYMAKITSEMESEGYGDFAVRMDVDSAGNPMPQTANIGRTMEYLTKKYLHYLTGRKLLFQRAGEVKDTNGTIRLNEGLWHQVRRGRRITYGRPGGITFQHVREAAEYVFRTNPDLDYEDRRIKFKCGSEAFNNMVEIFHKEILEQQGRLGNFLGSDMQIPNPVGGSDLKNLTWNAVRFTKVYVPQIGMIDIERDTSLDKGMFSQDRLEGGMHANGRAHTTYSMIIWDASSSAYSNNMEGLPKDTSLVKGGNSGANIFLVKPKGAMMYSGTERGRYDSTKSRDIVSSNRYMGESYWAYNNCDVWVKDYSKFVMIELEPDARKGFN